MEEAIERKNEVFKYFLYELNKVYQDTAEKYTGKRAYPALRFVEIMKLLFFTCVLKKELLNTFDNWVALPKGPIEDDAYAYLKSERSFMEKSNDYGRNPNNCNDLNFETVSSKDKTSITFSLEYLQNTGLLRMPEDFLVEVSHRWDAWKTPFIAALEQGKRAKKMNINDIVNERIYI